MNDLNDRLDALADAGVGGIDLARPDVPGPAPGAPWWRRPSAVALAGATVLLLVVVATAIVLGGEDDETVRTAPTTEPVTGMPASVVAVTYGDGGLAVRPVEQIILRFLQADGALIAERQWSEVEEPVPGSPGQVSARRGLVQSVPTGDVRLEVTWIPYDTRVGAPLTCDVDFTIRAGDRLILRLQGPLTPGVDVCAGVQALAVEEWTQDRTGRTGLDYLGLRLAEAEAEALAAGFTSRVVGDNGMDLAVTMDLRTDRLDLMVFDGVVVAAILGGEAPVEVPTSTTTPTASTAPAASTTVAAEPGRLRVDLEPIEGILFEGFDVTLRFVDTATGEVIAEREWSDEPLDDSTQAWYEHVLEQEVPAGRVRLVTWMRISPGGAIPPPEGPGCETLVDVSPGESPRVTVLFGEDEGGACAAIAAATAEADELLDLPRGWPAPGFVGLTEAEAESQATERGWTTRVVARDGTALARTDDLREDRVNLVVEDGIVVAAART